MKYRDALILPEKALNESGTETIDINLDQHISRLELRYQVTTAKHSMDAHPAKDITKIELVNGSDVLHSLNGYENQALCIYDRKCPTMLGGMAIAPGPRESMYSIDFGRKLWDTELAFDPTRFRNPQLKVSYSRILSDTTATANALEVWAKCFDEKVISPIGFLMSKEHKEYSIGDDGSYEYTDLPTDYPVRKLLVRAYSDAATPWAQIKEARIDEEHEKRIPFDFKLDDYFRRMRGVWANVVEYITGVCTSTGAFAYYVTPTDYWKLALGNQIDTGYLHPKSNTVGDKYIPMSDAGAPYFIALIIGYLPNHCFEFPFGDQEDLDDWWDVTRLGSARLRLRAGTTGSGTGQIVLQQLRRY